MPSKIVSGLIAGWLLTATALLAPTAQAATRVVSLGGDITGIVYALKAGDTLVGVDSTSTWPAQARTLPNVGYVRQLSAEGILALHPDLIVATHDAGPPAVMQQLEQLGQRLEILPSAHNGQGIVQKVRTLGQLLDRPAQAAELIARLQAEAETLQARVKAMPRHPRVVFVMNTGTAGLMVAGRGTAADAAITLAGGDNVVIAYRGYKPLAAESLVLLKPEVLLVMDTGQHSDNELLNHPAVRQTPAGRHHQVIRVEGEKLLGFGVRTLSAATALQAQLARVPIP